MELLFFVVIRKRSISFGKSRRVLLCRTQISLWLCYYLLLNISKQDFKSLNFEQYRQNLRRSADTHFIIWHNIIVKVEGVGAYSGSDINYYRTGMITAAAGRSLSTTGILTIAYNLLQPTPLVDGDWRAPWHDWRQIESARSCVDIRYHFYLDHF